MVNSKIKKSTETAVAKAKANSKKALKKAKEPTTLPLGAIIGGGLAVFILGKIVGRITK